MALSRPASKSRSQPEPKESQPFIEELTPEDVKRFLDPTLMINGLGYSFTANHLLQNTKLYTHNLEPMWAVNHWTAFWAKIPFNKLSIPDQETPTAVGDILVGWGAVIHEDLSRRFTSSAGWFEVLAPSGNVKRGGSFGTWVLAPGGGIALNPIDTFPVYITGRYLHSLGDLGGGGSGSDAAEQTDLRVRSIELDLETIHIFPKGFYVAALPSFVFNLNQDFNFFSLGVGVGRALNRNFAVVGGYVHHMAGRKTFSQGFTVGLNFVWGEVKQKGEPQEKR
jgi:hypothetical protein